MTRRSKFLVLGGLLAVAMTIYPPWCELLVGTGPGPPYDDDRAIQRISLARYHSLLYVPPRTAVIVDISRRRLYNQYLILSVIIGIGFVLLTPRRQWKNWGREWYRRILLIGVILALAMAFCPPWITEMTLLDPELGPPLRTTGYSVLPILDLKDGETVRTTLDVERLYWQYIILIGVISALCVLLSLRIQSTKPAKPVKPKSPARLRRFLRDIRARIALTGPMDARKKLLLAGAITVVAMILCPPGKDAAGYHFLAYYWSGYRSPDVDIDRLAVQSIVLGALLTIGYLFLTPGKRDGNAEPELPPVIRDLDEPPPEPKVEECLEVNSESSAEADVTDAVAEREPAAQDRIPERRAFSDMPADHDKEVVSETPTDERATIPKPKANSTPGPKGIAGWLIVPAIGLVIAPIKSTITFLMVFDLVRTLAPELHSDPRLWLVWLIEVGVIVAVIAVAVLFFMKRRAAVPAMIGLMVAIICAGIAQAGLNASLFGEIDDETTRSIVGRCVYGAVWIPYFLRSKRVKNTFTG